MEDSANRPPPPLLLTDSSIKMSGFVGLPNTMNNALMSLLLL